MARRWTRPNSVDVPNGSSASGELDGSWELQTGDSFVGYRVREQLAILPAPSDAVGRRTAVEGGLDVSGLEITKVDVTADDHGTIEFQLDFARS